MARTTTVTNTDHTPHNGRMNRGSTNRGSTAAEGAPQSTSRTTVTVNIPLPVDLHRALRLKAVASDLTMKDAITAAVAAWVADKPTKGGR